MELSVFLHHLRSLPMSCASHRAPSCLACPVGGWMLSTGWTVLSLHPLMLRAREMETEKTLEWWSHSPEW